MYIRRHFDLVINQQEAGAGFTNKKSVFKNDI